MIDWSSLFKKAYPWQGTMPVIEISGEPYDLGFQHGKICKYMITKIADEFIQKLVEITGVEKSKIIDEALKYEKAILGQIGDEYIEEMKGIADGAEVDYKNILILNCGWDLLNSLPTPETHPSYMCSSFSSFADDTRNGNLICGHNDDGARNIDQFLVLLKATPAKGRSFAAPVVPGYIGYHRMWNDSGTVLFGLSLEKGVKDEVFDYNIPMWVLLRHLIQYKESTDEIVQGLAEYPPPTAFNFLISDKTASVKICHVAANNIVKISPEGSTAVLTNHALVDDIKPVLVMRDHPSSTDYRFQTVKRFLDGKKGKIDVKAGKEALSSHYDSSTKKYYPSANTPCSHHEYEGKMAGTVSTVVIEIKEKQLSAYISLGNPCENRWTEDVLEIK